MTHPIWHAESSVRRFGGSTVDYLPIHEWLDATKETLCDCRHRALRHHSQGVFEAERVFGHSIVNADGATVPVRYIALCRIKHNAIYALRRTMPSLVRRASNSPHLH